jgi:hypothetical protein
VRLRKADGGQFATKLAGDTVPRHIGQYASGLIPRLGALLVLLLNGREGHGLGWAGMASDADWQEPGQLSD